MRSFRRHEVPVRPRSEAAGTTAAVRLAFLRGVVSDACLDAAADESRRIGACPINILIANGWVPARKVYKQLAAFCGVPFVDDWPEIEPLVDAAAALSAGRIRLRDAARTRLVAPQGDALSELLDRDAAARWSPMAVTTPAHLMALVHRRTQASVAYFAGMALPDLMPGRSARGVGTPPWRAAIALVAILMLAAPLGAPHAAGDVLGLLFCAGMVFRLLVGAAAYLPAAPEPPPLADVDLPTYSVLVPLRQEGDVVPDLLAALDALDYPRAKFEVLLLVEPEDLDTRAALAVAWLPPWLQVLIGPIGGALRTKPRALNIGLAAASGSLVTIYDAEDRPAPDQLRRAAAWFHADPGLACLQARLSIRAGGDPLSRLFAIEYAGLFGLLNRGLAALGLPIPLGGTSNHLRTSVVRDVGGWDAWNVAEDADLGLRLGHLGYRVACFDSVTEESAPHSLAVWMRQRRRWTKGWIQTCLVLGRELPSVIMGFGAWRATSVALLMLGLIVGPLLSPTFGVLVLCHLVQDGLPTPHGSFELAEATLAASVLLMGIASPLWFGWAGLRVAGQARLISTLPLVLLYQLLVAVAAWGGLYDLLRRPFHWHKTPHRPEAGATSKLHGLGPSKPIAARSRWGRRDRSSDRQRPRRRRRGQAAPASPPRSGWPPASA